jgi:hypothetical protein
MKQRFDEIELLMAIDDKQGLLVGYAKNRPADIHALIKIKQLEIEIRLKQVDLLSLTLARALSQSQ